MCHDGPTRPITADPSSLRVPLLSAHGRHDYTVPCALWEGVVPTWPDATLHLFEQSGHQPFFEEPERFAAAVTDWMSRQR
ncbi:alpha/beta fold hydrolase [Sorangium sp. So ce1099]|uniref:alpha/beta fold hydrolase n=1 Tax=Sorangium sp. So ce1099 TaxID=3133331 RepID=UPI003F5FE66A